MTAVIDASVLVAAVVDSGADGHWARSMIGVNTLIAPELLLAESTNVLRRKEIEGAIGPSVAEVARRDVLRRDIEDLGLVLLAISLARTLPECRQKPRGRLQPAARSTDITPRFARTPALRTTPLHPWAAVSPAPPSAPASTERRPPTHTDECLPPPFRHTAHSVHHPQHLRTRNSAPSAPVVTDPG